MPSNDGNHTLMGNFSLKLTHTVLRRNKITYYTEEAMLEGIYENSNATFG
jgi:hypothetical protein